LSLTELHVHVGSAVDPAIMWGIAHTHGIRLPTKDYWEFRDLITAHNGRVKTFEDYLQLFYWTELIQSSPLAIERSVYEIIGGAYRKNNITTLELRFNPMKRNRGGERDLDHIIAAALRGMDRAGLEYPIRTGLVLCMDKAFSYTMNEIIVKKAILHRERGIVGIDIAGPEDPDFSFGQYAALAALAREAGLGVTVHAGESGTLAQMREAVLTLRPSRVGHGIKAADDPETVDLLREQDIVLEICPTSNLRTGVVSDLAELGRVLRTFKERGVKFCINTDGPEMLGTTLRRELILLLSRGVLSLDDVVYGNECARAASFVRPPAP